MGNDITLNKVAIPSDRVKDSYARPGGDGGNSGSPVAIPSDRVKDSYKYTSLTFSSWRSLVAIPSDRVNDSYEIYEPGNYHRLSASQSPLIGSRIPTLEAPGVERELAFVAIPSDRVKDSYPV